jgi:hypothetical protein
MAADDGSLELRGDGEQQGALALADCRSEADVLAVLLREFHRWFGADIREDKANYREIAVELWELWCRRRQRIARELLKSDPECRKDG